MQKGMRVAFIEGQVIMWPKGKTIDDAIVIGALVENERLVTRRPKLLVTIVFFKG